jgi:Dipeptidyl aminopeptidases/acylaminoacyl-peptidases
LYLLLAFVVALPSAALSAEKAEPAVIPKKGTEKLPVTAFARIPFVDHAEISPDGTHVAGLFASGGERVIAILPLFSKDEKWKTVKVPDGLEARWIKWVNDDNIIICATNLDYSTGNPFYVSRVHALNRITGKVTLLLSDLYGQNAGDVVWIPHDGSSQILISAQASIYMGAGFWPAIYRVDVTNGHKSRIAQGRTDINHWIADGSGRIRAGIGYSDANRTFSLVYRPQAGGSVFKTISRADSRKRESLITPFLFLPDEHVLVTHDNEEGLNAVYEFDLAAQKDVKTIFTATDGEVDDVILSDDGNSLLGITTTSQNQGTVWLDPSLRELQGQFDKAVPKAKANIESMNRDWTKMLVRIDAPDKPGALYFYDVDDGRLQKFAFINETIGSRRLAPVKLIHYKARDGLPIEGVLTLPENREPHRLPLIVMPHGGPWAQDVLSYDYWAQFLANRGYAVLQPNFRGSTGYGTEFLRRGEGQLGYAMQDDITDGVRWAVAEGLADPKRVCIVGASYGGYAAMWGIVKDPELYRCAISIAGVANLRREVNDFGSYLMKGKFRDDWQRMTPDFMAVSPYNFADKIKVPLLLIHGKKDATVDHGQSARMNGRMREAGKAVEFVSLPQADHFYTREADRTALLSAMERFLAANNPAD